MTHLENPPSIELEAITWEEVGETDPATSLLAHIRIGELNMHLEARQVFYEDGNQGTVDYPSDYDALLGVSGQAFSTLNIKGRDYLVFALPYGI